MFRKTKLKNRLTLITSPLKETKAVTVLLLLPVGSRYEPTNINGASHFIEHLMFKGTKKRPTSLDLTKELDSVGAEYNAFTGKDHTGYYIKITNDKIELAFDILSDMIFDSRFAAEEIDKERGVIIEEINMYEDNPLLGLHNLFEETVFGKHSLGRPISGPKKVIKEISRQQLINYRDKFYQPDNMVISVAGNFNGLQVKKLTEKYFGISKKSSTIQHFAKVNLKQTSPRINLMFKNTEQVHLGLGFPGFALNDRRIYSLYLLSVILGGNMSSRLFTIIREKYGLAYYIKAEASSYQDTGFFMVQAGLDKKRINDAIKLIIAELKKIKESGVTAKELKSAKYFLKGKLVLELEDSESVADWYGKQELLLKNIHTPQQKINKFLSVSQAQIKKTAQEVFKAEKLNLATIGPFKSREEFKKLLKI